LQVKFVSRGLFLDGDHLLKALVEMALLVQTARDEQVVELAVAPHRFLEVTQLVH